MLFPTHYTLKPPVGAQLIPGHPLVKDLVGAWLFNEGSGLNAFDLSNNENHGALNGGVSWKPKGLDFNGTDGYINCGSNPSLDNLTAFTYVVWIYPESMGEGSYGRILHKFSSADAYTIFLLDDVTVANGINGLIKAPTAGNSVSAANAIILNTWQQVVMSYNDTGDRKIRLYVNGVEVSYNTQTATSGTRGDDSDGSEYIGSSGTARWFNGMFNDARIYNRVLNVSEIKQLYYDPYCMFAQPMEAELMYAPPPVGVMSPYYYETLMAGAVV